MKTATLAFALLCLAATGAAADPRSDALAGVSRCQAIADNRTFLDCVYGAMQPLRAELGLPAAPASQVGLVPPGILTPSAAPRAAAPARDRGLLGGLVGGGTSVAAQRMAGFSFDKNGLFTVSLADGEVWQQVSGDNSLAHWHGSPGNYSVTIRGGVFGSFNLQVKGDATVFRVRRLR